MSALLPDPALRWLGEHGATVRSMHRVNRVDAAASPASGRWSVDGEPFDGVALACTAVEASRLAAPHAPAWAELARNLSYEPIVTVYAHSEGARLEAPMLALRAGASGSQAPAQFVFDLGWLGAPAGTLAFVISGAADAVARGLAETEAATLRQGTLALERHLRAPLAARRTLIEKRATFLCRVGLCRPPADIAPALVAAGDYVDGPYPATLEGAVRSGLHAAQAIDAAPA